MEYIIALIVVIAFSYYGVRVYMYVRTHIGDYDTDNRLDSVSK
jgi:hypothetical protein